MIVFYLISFIYSDYCPLELANSGESLTNAAVEDWDSCTIKNTTSTYTVGDQVIAYVPDDDLTNVHVRVYSYLDGSVVTTSDTFLTAPNNIAQVTVVCLPIGGYTVVIQDNNVGTGNIHWEYDMDDVTDRSGWTKTITSNSDIANYYGMDGGATVENYVFIAATESAGNGNDPDINIFLIDTQSDSASQGTTSDLGGNFGTPNNGMLLVGDSYSDGVNEILPVYFGTSSNDRTRILYADDGDVYGSLTNVATSSQFDTFYTAYTEGSNTFLVGDVTAYNNYNLWYKSSAVPDTAYIAGASYTPTNGLPSDFNPMQASIAKIDAGYVFGYMDNTGDIRTEIKLINDTDFATEVTDFGTVIPTVPAGFDTISMKIGAMDSEYFTVFRNLFDGTDSNLQRLVYQYADFTPVAPVTSTSDQSFAVNSDIGDLVTNFFTYNGPISGITLDFTSGNPSTDTWMTLTNNGDGSANLTGIVSCNECNDFNVSISATDSCLTVSADDDFFLFGITNAQPTIEPQLDTTATAGTASGTWSFITNNFTDPESCSLTLSVEKETWMGFTQTADDQAEFDNIGIQIPYDVCGSTTINVTADDGCTQTLMQFDVLYINDAPEYDLTNCDVQLDDASVAQAVVVGQTWTWDLNGGATTVCWKDPEDPTSSDNSLTLTAEFDSDGLGNWVVCDGVSNPEFIADNYDGTFTWTTVPTSICEENREFRVHVTDGCSSNTYYFNLTLSNYPPTLSGAGPAEQNINAGEGLNYTIDIAGWYTDESSTLVIANDNADTIPFVTFDGTDIFEITPDSDECDGIYEITFDIVDECGLFLEQAFNVTITNRVPTVSTPFGPFTYGADDGLQIEAVSDSDYSDPDGEVAFSMSSTTYDDLSPLDSWITFNTSLKEYEIDIDTTICDFSKTIRLEVSDSCSNTVNDDWVLTITNADPTINGAVTNTSSVAAGTTGWTYDITFNFEDPEGHLKNITCITGCGGVGEPTWTENLADGNGTLLWDVPSTRCADQTIVLKAFDDCENSVEASSFNIIVTNTGPSLKAGEDLDKEYAADTTSNSITILDSQFEDPNLETSFTMASTQWNDGSIWRDFSDGLTWMDGSFSDPSYTFDVPGSECEASYIIGLDVTDGCSNTVRVQWLLNVTNQLPIVSDNIVDDTAFAGDSWNYAISNGAVPVTFSDPENEDLLQVVGRQKGDVALPGTMTFTDDVPPTTGSFDWNIPATTCSGFVELEVKAEDACNLWVFSNVFNLTITNRPPYQSGTPVQDQTFPAGALNTYTLLNNMYTDDDGESSWTFVSTEIVGGGAFPGYLSFDDVDTYTVDLVASPNQCDETTNVSLTVEDACGNTFEDNFLITIDNTPPTINVQAPNADLNVGDDLSVTGSFQDADLQTVTMTFQQTDYSELPLWIDCSPTGNSFTCIDLDDEKVKGCDGELIEVLIEASDVCNSVVPMYFNISITNNNPAETAGTPLEDKLDERAGQLFTYNFASAFGPGASDAGEWIDLTFDSTSTDGSNTSWLTLTNNGDGSGTLEGTPTGCKRNYTITVYAVDSCGGAPTAQDSFLLEILSEPPTLGDDNPMPNQNGLVAGTYYENTFADNPSHFDGDDLTYSIEQADTTPVPSWLTLDPVPNIHVRIYGTPEDCGDSITIRVFAENNCGTGESVNRTFDLTWSNDNSVTSSPPSPSVGNAGEFFEFTESSDFDDADAGEPIVIIANTLPVYADFYDNGDRSYTINGTYPTGCGNINAVELEGTDTCSSHIAATSNFNLQYTNTIPSAGATPVTDITGLHVGGSVVKDISNTVFYDPDTETIVLTSTQVDDSPLPSFLEFTDDTDRSGSYSTAAPGTIPYTECSATYNIKVIATDSCDQDFSRNWQLEVLNDEPFVNLGITNPADIHVGETLSHNILATAFTNTEAGETVTLSKNSGPAWMTLTDNGDGTGSLGGTVTQGLCSQSVPSSVNMTDQCASNADASATFTVNIINAQPAVTTVIPDFEIHVGEDPDYSFPISFTAGVDDVNEVLDVTSSGEPTFVTFTGNNDGSGSYTGTVVPTDACSSTYVITVEAADQCSTNTPAQDSFNYQVINAQPAVTTVIPDFEIHVGEDPDYSFPISFTAGVDDVNEDLDVTSSGEPTFVTFTGNNDGSGSYTGTVVPTDSCNATYVITVEAADQCSTNTPAQDSFNYVVINNPPQLLSTIDEQKGKVGEKFEFTFAEDLFSAGEDEINDVLTYTYEDEEGEEIKWLTLEDRKFSGTPTDKGEIIITVIASDECATNAPASTSFKIKIDPKDEEDDDNLASIIGGVVGALFGLGLIIVFVKKTRKDSPEKTLVGDILPSASTWGTKGEESFKMKKISMASFYGVEESSESFTSDDEAPIKPFRSTIRKTQPGYEENILDDLDI